MNNKKVFTNLIWRFAERCGAQGVTFIVSIVLARLLAPKDYGTIALVTVFTAILQVFVDSGLGNSLIQKKNADDLDFSTVFFFNISVCCVLYAGMFVAAPFISNFYNRPDLVPVIRVLSLTIVISGVKNVQQAYVSRTMQFKRFFFATLGGTIGAAALGIGMAYWGFGVWALVTQQIFNATVDTIILWVTVKWRPKKMFSLKRLKGLFSYGWKILVSALLDTGYRELRSLIIGKKYSSADLAYYNQGQKFPNLIVTNINASIDSVLLPAMSNVQDDRKHVKNMTRRSIMVSTYIMAPLMIGLFFTAVPVIRLILTEKWLPCVVFLRVFCLTFLFMPIHTANLNAIKAMGRSDLFLKLEILKKIVGMALLFATMWISVEAMAYSLLISNIASQIINSWPNKKLLGYSYIEQLKDILPSIFLSVFMGVSIWLFSFLNLPDIVTLLIQVVTGGIIYIIGSRVFKLTPFQYIIGIIEPYLKKLKK